MLSPFFALTAVSFMCQRGGGDDARHYESGEIRCSGSVTAERGGHTEDKCRLPCVEVGLPLTQGPDGNDPPSNGSSTPNSRPKSLEVEEVPGGRKSEGAAGCGNVFPQVPAPWSGAILGGSPVDAPAEKGKPPGISFPGASPWSPQPESNR